MNTKKHNQNPYDRWRQIKSLVTNLHVWVVILILGLVAVLHYLGLGNVHLLNIALPNFAPRLSRHSVERVVLVFPAIYAGFVFGIKAGMLSLLVAAIIMLPRALLISPHPLDATLETAMVAVVCAMVLWIQEAQDRVRRLRDKALVEAQALNSISTAITQSLELEQILDLSLRRIANVMGADISWVYLLDQETQELAFAAQYGLSEALLEGADRLKVGEGLNGWVAQSGRPLAVENISTDYRLTRQVVKLEGLQGFLAVPLRSKDEVIGTLGIAMFHPHRFSSDEMRLLSTIGNQIGVAIENARLYEDATGVAAQLQTSAENLRSYVRQITRAQEEERKRIARELHDDTVQALALLSRRLDKLSSSSEQMRTTLPGSLGELRELTDSILTGLRRFSRDLRPPVLDDLGLLPALTGLTMDLTREGGIRVTVEVVGRERRLSPETELTLFRIAQEALNNVKKHSKAGKAALTVEFGDGSVEIAVSDNGRGFEMPARIEDLAAAGKLGLVGMRERARLLGGTLTVQSQPGEGTRVVVNVPL